MQEKWIQEKKIINVQCARCRRCTIVLWIFIMQHVAWKAWQILDQGGFRINFLLVMESRHVFFHGRHPGGMWVCSSRCDLSISQKKSQSVCRAWALLVKLYDGHTAAVLTDVERVKSFRISGGTKQRNSLPSLSCLSVRKSSMESDTRSWWEKGFGIELEDHKKSCTSNVRFAADALLMVNSLRQPKKMTTYTKRSTEEED